MNALNLFGGSGKVGQLMAAIARVLIPKEPSPYCTGLSFTPDHCLDRHSREGGNPVINNRQPIPANANSNNLDSRLRGNDELAEPLRKNLTGLTS